MNRLLRLAAALMFLGCTALRAQETWTATASPTTQNLWSVCYGAGQFVAVGEGGTILTSADGLAWTKRVSGNTLWLVGVGYGNGLFVVVGDQGTILTSPDGITWTSRRTGGTRINGVAYGGGRYVAVAESGELLTSTDATTWTKLSPSTDRLRGLTYAYGEFVITGDNGLVRVTIDTTDYDSRVLPDGLFVESVAYARRRFLAVGEAGYAITSVDAVTWQRVATGTAAYLRGVTFFNGQFIAVGERGTVLTTADATSPWTPRAAGTTALFTAAAASDAAAVVVGFGGTIIRSAPAAAAPAIATAPASSIAAAGDNVLFAVTATGSLPLTYQWNFNGQPLPGRTSDQLLMGNAQLFEAGAYTVTVTNSRGSVTSAPASLTFVGSTEPGPIVDATFAPTVTISGNVTAAVEQADGKVIIGGSQFLVTPGVSPFALARLNLDGSLDTTFNISTGLSADGSVRQLVQQPDGKLLIGGSQFFVTPGVSPFALARLNADGSLDATFTAAAPVTTEALVQIGLQSDGKILVLTNTRLIRLSADGSSDASFVGATTGFVPSFFVVLTNGQILAGSAGAVGRLNANGSIDSTFTPPIGSNSYNSYTGLQIAPDGGVFLGSYSYGGIFGSSASLGRLNPDGTSDPKWPGLSVRSGPRGAASYRLAFDTAGKIYFATTSTTLAGPTLRTMARYNPDASLDSSFDARKGPDGDVTGIFPLRDGRVIVAGAFSTFDGIARPRLVRLVATNALARKKPVIVFVTPEAAAVRPGEPVTLTVVAAGSGSLSFRWSDPIPESDRGKTILAVPTKLSGTYNFTVTVSNNVGTVTSAPVRVIVAPSAPVILAQPTATVASAGRTVVLAVDVAGTAPFSYQWFRGGTLVGTSSSLTLTNLTAADSGDYIAVVRNSLGSTTSQVARLGIVDTPQLVNISTRATVGPAERALIAGFVIRGVTTKNILVRGVGPSLTTFGLTGLLPNPVLTLFDGAGRTVATNDNWDFSATPPTLFSSLGAFALFSGSADAALQVALAPGSYTAVITDSASRTGTGLVEVYEADNNTTRIVNLSSRAFVGTDASIGIAGIAVRGQNPGRYLIRGVGPALEAFGVSGTLADPVLTLTTATGATVATNDDWATNASATAADIAAAATQVGAFPLPASSRDAALLLTLAPGNYTALVSGANGTTGVALVEVYEVP